MRRSACGRGTRGPPWHSRQFPHHPRLRLPRPVEISGAFPLRNVTKPSEPTADLAVGMETTRFARRTPSYIVTRGNSRHPSPRRAPRPRKQKSPNLGAGSRPGTSSSMTAWGPTVGAGSKFSRWRDQGGRVNLPRDGSRWRSHPSQRANAAFDRRPQQNLPGMERPGAMTAHLKLRRAAARSRWREDLRHKLALRCGRMRAMLNFGHASRATVTFQRATQVICQFLHRACHERFMVSTDRIRTLLQEKGHETGGSPGGRVFHRR